MKASAFSLVTGQGLEGGGGKTCFFGLLPCFGELQGPMELEPPKLALCWGAVGAMELEPPKTPVKTSRIPKVGKLMASHSGFFGLPTTFPFPNALPNPIGGSRKLPASISCLEFEVRGLGCG